jgi:hypothetical protein
MKNLVMEGHTTCLDSSLAVTSNTQAMFARLKGCWYYPQCLHQLSFKNYYPPNKKEPSSSRGFGNFLDQSNLQKVEASL